MKTITDIVSQLRTGAKAVTAAEDGGLASSEVVQNYLPGANVVKAMNTSQPKYLPQIHLLETERGFFLGIDDPTSRHRIPGKSYPLQSYQFPLR